MGRHRGHHHFTVGQRRGIGLAAPEPLYVLRTDAATNAVTVGSRESWRRATRRACATRRFTATPSGSTAVQLRYHSRAARLPDRGRAPTPAGIPELDAATRPSPATGVAPGQTASLMDGEAIVGHATIA